MNSTLPIGDFSRATHLSVKMLRHYHEIGLLEPVDVDVDTGYRRYGTEQIVTAQIIRRFRDLDMPLEDIQIVLQARDVETRNRVITNHLARLESSLAQTRDAVASLRQLLDHPQPSVPIDHRHLAATPAAVVTDIVDKADALAWYRGAIGELTATLSAQDINPAGPAGGVFDTELFTEDRGRATIFLPCDPVPQPIGRVSSTVIPPAELATIVHPGPHTDIDRTYGVLAAYVTQHALAIDGPIREQATKPQTLGYGLTDSPVGQAAWIVEKFKTWSDCGEDMESSFTKDELLDNVMVYWLNAAAASSARLYWHSLASSVGSFDVVPAPSAYSRFPADNVAVSERWARTRYTDLRYYGTPKRGGHFAAYEAPGEFVAEVRAGLRALA